MQRQDYQILEEEIIIILENADRPLLLSDIMTKLETRDFRFPLIQNTVDMILNVLGYRGLLESTLTSITDLGKPVYWSLLYANFFNFSHSRNGGGGGTDDTSIMV